MDIIKKAKLMFFGLAIGFCANATSAAVLLPANAVQRTVADEVPVSSYGLKFLISLLNDDEADPEYVVDMFERILPKLTREEVNLLIGEKTLFGMVSEGSSFEPHASIAQMMANMPHINPNLGRDEYGNNPVHSLILFQNYQAIRAVLSRADLTARNKDGKTVADLVMENEEVMEVADRVVSGRFLEALNAQDLQGNTALHKMVMPIQLRAVNRDFSDAELAESVVPSADKVVRLLRLGCKTDIQNFEGLTPLMVIAKSGSLEHIEHFKALLPVTNLALKSNSGDTVLHFAIRSQEQFNLPFVFVDLIIKEAIRRGGFEELNIFNLQNSNGNTVLHELASSFESLMMDQILIEADIAKQTGEGLNAIPVDQNIRDAMLQIADLMLAIISSKANLWLTNEHDITFFGIFERAYSRNIQKNNSFSAVSQNTFAKLSISRIISMLKEINQQNSIATLMMVYIILTNSRRFDEIELTESLAFLRVLQFADLSFANNVFFELAAERGKEWIATQLVEKMYQ